MRQTGIKYTLDLDEFVREVKQIPNVTDKQLDKMVRAWTRRNNQVTREMARAAKEAEKAAKAAADRTQVLAQRWDDAGKVAGAFSGQLGSAFSSATNLGKGLGGLVTPTGLAAAGVAAVGFAAVSAARSMWQFMESAEAAIERLNEIEGVPPIPPDVQESMERWEKASLAAEVAATQLRLELATALSPAMSDLANALAGATGLLADVIRGLRELRQGIADTKRTLDEMVDSTKEALGPIGDLLFLTYDVVEGLRSFIASGGALGVLFRSLRDRGAELGDGLRDIAGATDDAREALDEYIRASEQYLGLQEEVLIGLTGATDEQVRYAKEVDRINKVVDQRLAALEAEGTLNEQAIRDAEALRSAALGLAGAVRDEAAARREAREEAERLARAREAAARAAREEAEAASYVNEGLRIEARLRRERAEATAGLQALIREVGLDEMTEAERAADRHKQRLAQINELAKSTTEAHLVKEAREESEARLQRELIDIRDRAHERAKQQSDELRDREQAAAQARFDSHMRVAEAMVGAISSVADLFAVKGREMSEDEKKRLQAAFRGQQLAMTGQIAMYTAAAIQRALVDLGPVAGAIAAGGITISGAAQTAAVWAQPVPEFPRGGLIRAEHLSADHGLVGVQQGEGVVSRRGMQQLGEDGLARLNRGEPQPPIIVVSEQVYRHRIFDRFVRDNILRPGPLGNAVSDDGAIGHSVR